MFNKQHKLPVAGCPAACLQCSKVQHSGSLEKDSVGMVILSGAYLVSKWAQVGRLEFAFWTIQLFVAPWILKLELSVLLISFDFASASHRILAWDSYLTSSNFWLNYSMYLRHAVHFNFCWWFFCALQQCVQRVIIFTIKDLYFLSHLAFF